MHIYLFSLTLGVIAGLRAMTAPAGLAWAARLRALPLATGALALFTHPYAVPILTGLAVMELITDKLPATPSRKIPLQFGTRLISGALCGAAIASTEGVILYGALAGLVGAVIGTLAGSAVRARLARALGGKDLPVALLEDITAISLVAAIIYAL